MATESNIPHGALSLPALPAGLTPDWVTQALLGSNALRVNRAAGEPRVVSITASPVGEGVGMMSELSRLHLTWSDPDFGLPATVIAKYASTNATNRAAANQFHVYEREVRYFLELDERTRARTPRIHYGRIEPDNFLILMEDLGTYRIGSQATGAGLADAECAIDELARLHAAFWGRVDELDWVPEIRGSYHADGLRQAASAGWDNMARTFAAGLSPVIDAARADILAAIPKLQATVNRAPKTLVHGDFRLDNLLFASDPTHDPVVILDWQGPLRAKGIVDVAVLLGQNVHVETRRAHERALLTRYVRGLAAEGVDYPFEAAWQDYRDALLYQWCYCATITGALDGSNPNSFAWMSQCVARQSAATLDHHLLAELPRFL